VLSIKEQLFFSTHLIFKSLTGKEVVVDNSGERCILCGFYTKEVEPYKFSSKFINFDVFMSKNGVNTCPACAYVINSDRLKGLHNHYLATEDNFELFNLNHSEMKDKKTKIGHSFFTTGQRIVDLFADPPKEKHWMLMIREFGAINAKHISLNSKTNYGISDLIWVNIGQSSIAIPYFADGTYQDIYDALYQIKKVVRANDRRINYFLEGIRPYPKYEYFKLWEETKPILQSHYNTVYLYFMYQYVVPSYSLIDKLEKIKHK